MAGANFRQDSMAGAGAARRADYCLSAKARLLHRSARTERLPAPNSRLFAQGTPPVLQSGIPPGLIHACRYHSLLQKYPGLVAAVIGSALPDPESTMTT